MAWSRRLASSELLVLFEAPPSLLIMTACPVPIKMLASRGGRDINITKIGMTGFFFLVNPLDDKACWRVCLMNSVKMIIYTNE